MSPQDRLYFRENCAVFKKTHEKYGHLSNMASGYPIKIGNVVFKTSEALYQCCRFPDNPDVQEKIISQASPMAAKMVGKPFRDKTRADWDNVKVKIMRWCLNIKFYQNPNFLEKILETGNLDIVEESNRDIFWGAKPQDEKYLKGINALGRLLMQLRQDIEKNNVIIAPPVANIKIIEKEIGINDLRLTKERIVTFEKSLESNKKTGQQDLLFL